MHRRAFRPEASHLLEDRSLMSGMGRPSADPVVIRTARINGIYDQIQLSFKLYLRQRDFDRLGEIIQPVAVLVPFGRQDGLNVSISEALDQMKRDLAHGVGVQSVFSTYDKVIDLTRTELLSRIQAGDVVVRP